MIAELKRLIKKLRKKSLPAYVSGWSEPATLNTEYGSSGVIQYSTAINSNGEWKRAEPAADVREVKKPVEVVDSIVVEEPVMDLTNLDKQIQIVEHRIEVLEEQSVNLVDERTALSFLKARKKYKKYGHLFGWKVTNGEKIRELLSKYKLQLVSFSGYYKNVPNEALDELEKFALAFERVSNGKPHLELICDEGGPEQKKDPILLARSPFGRWYYILGAWDKEVEIVDDLIYNGK